MTVRREAAGDARLLRDVRWRLVAWSGLITLLILAVLGAAVYVAVARSLEARGEELLRERASAIQNVFSAASERRRLPIGLAFGGPGSGTFALLVDPSGRVLSTADAGLAGLPDTAGVSAARAGTTDYRQLALGGTPVRILSEPMTQPDGTYVIQVVGDRTGDARTLDVVVLVLAIGGLGAVALALIGGTLYAGRALVPIRESLRRQREFAADASHELRTPLAVVRGSVEHLRRHPEASVASVGSALGDIDAEVAHLSTLVEDLLLLARADSGVAEVQRLPLDLADVTAEALGGLSNLAADRRVRLAFDGRPTPLVGDPGRLRQLVTILVDNALRHGPTDATVTIRVGPERGRALLSVEDEGRGIREEDLPHVFERFWRAPDAPSGGTGLGLSIAAWIAERHGGTIAAEVAAKGARFVVRLPLARADVRPEAPQATQPAG